MILNLVPVLFPLTFLSIFNIPATDSNQEISSSQGTFSRKG